MLDLTCASRFDGEELRVDVGSIHCGKLNGQVTNVGRRYTVVVNEAGNLNASLARQIGDAAVVEHVATNLQGGVRPDRFHNTRSIFVSASVLNIAAVHNFLFLLLPVCNLIDATARIFVKRNVKLFNQVIATCLDVEGIIFSVMLAAFGAVVAKLFNIVKANHIPVLLVGVLFLCTTFDFGVEIVAVLIENLKQPSHVVNARDFGLNGTWIDVKSENVEKSGGTDLHAVAKTNGLDLCVALHIARKDRHGIGVVEEPRVGANLFNILCKALHNVNSAQTPHNTANAERVANGLAQTVFLWNLEVDNGAGEVV